MNPFVKPNGINFHSAHAISAVDLSKMLCQTVAFLQNLELLGTVCHRYDDWWEHDGLHFEKGAVTASQLFSLIESPRHLLEAMPGDDSVFIGIAPLDNHWYLRFLLEWDEDDRELVGRFDITLPSAMAVEYRKAILGNAGIRLSETDANAHYLSVGI